MARSAFDFSPKVSILFKVAMKQTISKTNLALLAIDTAVSLIEAGCAYIRYSEAKKQTSEIRNQIRIQKEQIDEEVKQKEAQIESEYQLMTEQLMSELNNQRRVLQLNAEKIRNEMSTRMEKDIKDSEIWLKNLDLQQLAIQPVKSTLDLYDKLMLLSNSNEHKKFAELEEQYRMCLQKYTMLRNQNV